MASAVYELHCQLCESSIVYIHTYTYNQGCGTTKSLKDYPVLQRHEKPKGLHDMHTDLQYNTFWLSYLILQSNLRQPHPTAPYTETKLLLCTVFLPMARHTGINIYF